MGEDIMELIWQRGEIVIRSQTQRPGPTTRSPSPPILRGSGSGSGGGGGEGGDGGENVPVQQNLLIREDEMMAWLQYPLGEDESCGNLLYPGVASTSATQLQSTICQEQLQPIGQIIAARPPIPMVRRAENETRTVQNFVNFSRLRGNINEAGLSSISQPVVRELTQIDSSATPSSSVTESCITPATETTAIGGITHSFAVSGGVDRKGKAVATETVYEISGTPSSGISKAETELVQVEPVKEMEIAGDKKRKERDEREETKQACGSTSTKKSRVAEVHNLSERKRRDRINEKMKALQELIPRCNKSDKASMLDDAIEYMKALQLQLQMMSMRCGITPMMYTAGMQQFLPHMAMGMNQPPFIPFPGFLAGRPLPTKANMTTPVFPSPRYPVPDTHAFDPSRVYVPSQQSEPLSNQALFSGHIDPYSQFVGLHQMQQPPLQNQPTSPPPSFRPLPRQAHMASPVYPSPRYPAPNIHAFDPSRVYASSQQSDTLSNQAQFSGPIDLSSQFFGLQQMQQPPLQNQPISQPPSSRPLPRQAHMTSLVSPSPRYPVANIHAFDPSRIYKPSQQSDPLANQAQFSGHIDPYSQFVGLHQMQQPPLQLPSSRIPSSSKGKEPENQKNHSTGS